MPVGALGVGHDEHAGGRRLLDERLELGRPEVGVARIVARRQDAAARRDLDDVGAGPDELADLPAHLVGPSTIPDGRPGCAMHERDVGAATGTSRRRGRRSG